MSEIIRHGQPPVPAEFAKTLRRVYAQDSDRLNSLLLNARLNGWNLRTLGDALGMTREGIRKRVELARPATGLPVVPPAPRKPNPMPSAPRRLLLRQDAIDELREMQAVARTVNGAMDPDHAARRVSEQFTALLAGYVAQGVTVYYLAQVIGVTHYAIYARLARHGYRKQSPSVIGTNGETYKNRKVGGGAADECGRGHPLSGDNLRITVPRGQRVCRECERHRAREYQQRKRAAA